MFQKLATPRSIFDGEMSLGRRRKFLRLKTHLRKMRLIEISVLYNLTQIFNLSVYEKTFLEECYEDACSTRKGLNKKRKLLIV